MKLMIFDTRVSNPAMINTPPNNVDPIYPADRMIIGMPPSTRVAPPRSGSIHTRTTLPPVRIAYIRHCQKMGERYIGGTHCDYMAQLVPSNGKKLEWVDDDSSSGYIPKSKNDDSKYNDLRKGEFVSERYRAAKVLVLTTYRVGTYFQSAIAARLQVNNAVRALA